MLGLSTNPIPIKAAMKMLGRDTGEMRLPMTPLEDAGMAKLKEDARWRTGCCSGGSAEALATRRS